MDNTDSKTTLIKFHEFTSSNIVEEEPEEDIEHKSAESWASLPKRLNDMVVNDPVCNPLIHTLTERRREIYDLMRSKMRKAPSTVLDQGMKNRHEIDQQLAMNDKRLGDLLRFGQELISNIIWSIEVREMERRKFENRTKKLMLANLEKETAQATAEFEYINDRWSELGKRTNTYQLFLQLEEQKNRVLAVMRRKDAIIADYQLETERMNEKFVADQELQIQDMRCLIKRICTQVELQRDAHNAHIKILENTIDDHAQLFTLEMNTKWHDFCDIMNNSFSDIIQTMKSMHHFYLNKVLKVADSQKDLTKNTRIRLERESEILERELREKRQDALRNSEKLDYNHQVLMQRNEENILINNQQKRRVAELNARVFALRKQIELTSKKKKQTINALTDEIEHLHASISGLGLKFRKTRESNESTFARVWNMNYFEIRELIHKLYEIDRVVYEQYLRKPWNPPPVNLSNSQEVKMAKEKNFKETSKCTTAPKAKKMKSMEKNVAEIPPDTVRLMRNIMRKICDKSGFLIDDKLLKILEPFKEHEQYLVRIDNIFTALRVHQLKDIEDLTKIFQRYSYCPNCTSPYRHETLLEVFVHGKVPTVKPDTLIYHAYKKKKVVCPDHYLVMESALVLHAIAEFADKHRSHKSYKQLIMEGKIEFTESVKIADHDIKEFWCKFYNCMPRQKQQLWSIMEHAMYHFQQGLAQRQRLDQQVSFLRKQNKELKFFLKYHVTE